MSRLFLRPAEILQGDFTPASLNLLLVFQVNCSGCFLYALPLAAKLNEVYKNRIKVLGLSTAFEDLELNTRDNTKRLLESGELVGEPLRIFSGNGYKKYPIPITFPVAYDLVLPPDQFVSSAFIEELWERENTSGDQTGANKEKWMENMARFQLETYEKVGFSFAANVMQGTPTWILFDKELDILYSWFGHKSEEEVEGILDEFL